MTYQGHPSWNDWNRSLWMANDEGLYNWALSEIAERGTKDLAAAAMFASLDGTKTPDGAPWTRSGVRYALRDL